MCPNCFLQALTQKYIILIKNVYLEIGLVTCDFVKNSLIKVLLQFTAFNALLPCYFILSFELNTAFDDITSKKRFTFQSLFI